MRWTVALPILVILLGSNAGCRSQCDLVEAELRTKERLLREAHEELCKSQLYNEALTNELRAVRPQANTPLSPEHAAQIYNLKEIVLGRTTGGRDDDGLPGDEALHVVVEPRDPDGHAIKAPGALRVEAAQISPEGIKTPLCGWDVSPIELRRAWRSGFLTNGYDLCLPWKVLPSCPKVRVTVRLCAADGRVFETDKDLTVRVPHQPLPHSGPIVISDDAEVMPPAPPPTPPAPEKGPELQPAVKTDAFKPGTWQRSFHPQPTTVQLRRPEPFR
jgi:hypothetical protein